MNTSSRLQSRFCLHRVLCLTGIFPLLTGFLVLRAAPSLLPLVMLGLAAALGGLLLWAAGQITRSTENAEAARAALALKTREMDVNTQGMDAANALLAQASGRFQELFQGLPAACVCFDKDGRIMEWNRAFETLYALPEVWGHSVWDTIYSGSKTADTLAAVFEGERQEGIARTFRRADDSLVHLYCNIFPLRGVDGEITGAISADIDISAQHLAEEALRQSEERLHTLYNVTSQQALSFEEKTAELLQLGADQFGLPIGSLARVQGERYQIVQSVSPGDVIPPNTEYAVCDTYCVEALRMLDAVSYEEVGTTEQRDTSCYQKYGLEAYLGTPVRVNGEVWGTLCFAGRQPHPRLFTSGDRELLRLMAQWIGSEMARRQAEVAIKESEERFRIAIASISEGLIVMDHDGTVTLWNDSAAQILEMTRTEMHGLRPINPEFAAVREDGTKFPQGSYPLMASLRRGEAQHDVVMGLPRQGKLQGRGPGEMLWVSVNAKPLFLSSALEPYAVVATFTDITERRRSADQITRQMVQITDYAAVLEEQKAQLEEANRQLGRLALDDSLTGLGNRRAFEQRLTQEVAQAQRYDTPLSVLLLDVDLFKSYNDTFGHPAGDEVLRLLSCVLRSQGRETDFFARYGGEEFIIILPLTDADGAAALAERLRAAVERTSWPQRGVTASLGAATLLVDMPDDAALVAAADRALYAAKNAGRNCVFHAQSLTAHGPGDILTLAKASTVSEPALSAA